MFGASLKEKKVQNISEVGRCISKGGVKYISIYEGGQVSDAATPYVSNNPSVNGGAGFTN